MKNKEKVGDIVITDDDLSNLKAEKESIQLGLKIKILNLDFNISTIYSVYFIYYHKMMYCSIKIS